MRAAIAGLVALVLVWAPAASATAMPPPPCGPAAMYVVAHEDDSLLFLSPALAQDIAAGNCVRTVFLTAGDAGKTETYWSTREAGAEAAYAEMAGAADEWNASELSANGHPIRLETLAGDPSISLLFMRLPDGSPAGAGYPLYGEQSLMKLWNGGQPGNLEAAIDSIAAVDGSTSYGYQDLIETLASLIDSFQPQLVATQDYLSQGKDHSDHLATARLTREAQRLYGSPHRFVGYWDYPTKTFAPNVFGPELARKQAALYAYSAHDTGVCSDEIACLGSLYATWLQRQYVAGVETVGAVELAPTGLNAETPPATAAGAAPGPKSGRGRPRRCAAPRSRPSAHGGGHRGRGGRSPSPRARRRESRCRRHSRGSGRRRGGRSAGR